MNRESNEFVPLYFSGGLDRVRLQQPPHISEDLANVYLKFKQLIVPAKLHIYAGSGHGFGLRANDANPA